MEGVLTLSKTKDKTIRTSRFTYARNRRDTTDADGFKASKTTSSTCAKTLTTNDRLWGDTFQTRPLSTPCDSPVESNAR
jgi:hypothetical protein